MQVLFDRVLIKRQKIEQKSKGGIIIPDIAIEGEVLNTGTIVSFGETCKGPWSIGQNVMFNPHSPMQVTYNGEEFLIMKESDVYGII